MTMRNVDAVIEIKMFNHIGLITPTLEKGVPAHLETLLKEAKD
jgi:hypothetical protein